MAVALWGEAAGRTLTGRAGDESTADAELVAATATAGRTSGDRDEDLETSAVSADGAGACDARG
ncbi:MAG: hypothetical protein RML99_03690 [Anaerolineae bacterium]|nr:hypothetical protein [Anaerolineae bacterium]